MGTEVRTGKERCETYVCVSFVKEVKINHEVMHDREQNFGFGLYVCHEIIIEKVSAEKRGKIHSV